MTDPTREQMLERIAEAIGRVAGDKSSNEIVPIEIDFDDFKMNAVCGQSESFARIALDAVKVVLSNVYYQRDEARRDRDEFVREAAVLQDRIAKVREYVARVDQNGGGGYVRSDCIRDLLDGEGEKAEHVELSREEWNAAANARLDELGVTYSELAQMNRDGVFKSHQHKILWVLIGGTMEEGKQ